MASKIVRKYTPCWQLTTKSELLTFYHAPHSNQSVGVDCFFKPWCICIYCHIAFSIRNSIRLQNAESRHISNE